MMLPLSINQEDIFTFNLEVPYYNWFYPLQHSSEKNLILFQHKDISFDRIKGIYIHFPFCSSLCSFCPYIRTHVHDERLRNKYVNCLITEILSYQRDTSATIDCIFFGGGSPSLMSPDNFTDIMEALKKIFVIPADCEITIEANAKTINDSLCSAFQAFNVSTIRIGVQSFDKKSRDLYELTASIEDIYRSVELIHKHDLQVSLDLLFGHHGQNLHSFIEDIEKAHDLSPETIEIYHLNLLSAPERYWRSISNTKQKYLSARERIRYFKAGCERLQELGYQRWSGHGFSRLSDFDLLYHRCVYGTLGGYVGFGPGAISCDLNIMKWNNPGIQKYISDLSIKYMPTFKARRISNYESHVKRYVTELPYYGNCIYSEESLAPEIKKQFEELVQNGIILKKDPKLTLSNAAQLQFSSVMFFLLPNLDKKELGCEILSKCEKLGSKFKADMLWV